MPSTENDIPLSKIAELLEKLSGPEKQEVLRDWAKREAAKANKSRIGGQLAAGEQLEEALRHVANTTLIDWRKL